MITNIHEAGSLVTRYESITLEEIEKTKQEILNECLKYIEQAKNKEDYRRAAYAYTTYSRVAEWLTGFGSSECTLCVSISTPPDSKIPREFYTLSRSWTDCNKCLYSIIKKDGVAYSSNCHSGLGRYHTYCTLDGNAKTYVAVEEAKTAEELHAAFKARAQHIRTLLQKVEGKDAR